MLSAQTQLRMCTHHSGARFGRAHGLPSYLTHEKERPWSPGASSSIGSLLWPKPGLAAPYLKVASRSLPVCLLHTPAHRKYAGGCPQCLSSVHLCLVAMRVTVACFCFFGSADKMEQNKSNAKLHISWLGKQKPSMTLEMLPGFYFSFLQILFSPTR